MGRPMIPFVAADTCVKALSASDFKQEITRCLNFLQTSGISRDSKQRSPTRPADLVRSPRIALSSACKDRVRENGCADFTNVEVVPRETLDHSCARRCIRLSCHGDNPKINQQNHYCHPLTEVPKDHADRTVPMPSGIGRTGLYCQKQWRKYRRVAIRVRTPEPGQERRHLAWCGDKRGTSSVAKRD